MLKKQPKIVWKIGIDNVAEYHSGGRKGERPPFEPAFIDRDDHRPDNRREPQKREQAVCPDKRKHQRQQPDVFALEQQMDPEHRDDNGQRRGLAHIHPVVKRVGTCQQGREPNELMLDPVTIDQPIDRKNGKSSVKDGRHLGRHHRLEEPEERDLEQMEQEVMIGVILRVKYRQRQPLERWQPFSVLEVLPQQRRPSDVVITVPVTAANSVGPRLKERQDHQDRAKPEDQINDPDRRLRFKKFVPSLLFRGRVSRCFDRIFVHFRIVSTSKYYTSTMQNKTRSLVELT